ncbi:MAG TPA: carboxymuconolactone decarboxylase family protein [Magnetospirillaceae bacterium]|jgi:4-carboxymuconolactone decarboxylase
MTEPKRTLKERVKPVVPDLVGYTDNVLFGEIWERKGLSKRDRSLITIAALIASGRTEPLPDHILLGQKNGLTQAEIAEVITHLAFYSGWPSAMTAAAVLLETTNKA